MEGKRYSERARWCLIEGRKNGQERRQNYHHAGLWRMQMPQLHNDEEQAQRS